MNESDKIPDDIAEKEKASLERGTFRWLGTTSITDIECYGLINQAKLSMRLLTLRNKEVLGNF